MKLNSNIEMLLSRKPSEKKDIPLPIQANNRWLSQIQPVNFCQKLPVKHRKLIVHGLNLDYSK